MDAVYQILFSCLLLLTAIPAEAKSRGTPTKFYDGLQITAKNLAVKYKSPATEPLTKKLAKELHVVSVNDSNKKIQVKKAAFAPHSHSVAYTYPDTVAEVYVVAENDTLYSIARRFKVSVAQLSAWNALPANYHVHSGEKLEILKNKQKHSVPKVVKNRQKTTKNMRDTSQKNVIISTNNKNMLKLYCQWPTEGKLTKTFSKIDSNGIEISGKIGQPVKAAAAGAVALTGASIYGYGYFIVIRHDGGYLSSYANNRRVLVRVGQKVAKGQVIAEMGKVGAKSASLEFELRKNNQLVDPLRCLPKKR
jgi:lipoprotein NlpD